METAYLRLRNRCCAYHKLKNSLVMGIMKYYQDGNQWINYCRLALKLLHYW